jgi:hypothetical protein
MPSDADRYPDLARVVGMIRETIERAFDMTLPPATTITGQVEAIVQAIYDAAADLPRPASTHGMRSIADQGDALEGPRLTMPFKGKPNFVPVSSGAPRNFDVRRSQRTDAICPPYPSMLPCFVGLA